MPKIQRITIFKRMSEVGYKSFENAALFCKMRVNREILPVHWLHQVMQYDNSDIQCIFRHFNIDTNRLSQDVISTLSKISSSNEGGVEISIRLDEVIQNSWKYASLLFSSDVIRTGHILYSFLTEEVKGAELRFISLEFLKIDKETLFEKFNEICSTSVEKKTGKKSEVSKESSNENFSPSVMGNEEALKKYCLDLTEKAKEGKLDPIYGREDEIRLMIDILLRRRQNNPILVGEAGVGKSAIVEGFAAKLAKGDVPPALKNTTLLALDLGSLKAGASMKGEYEKRVKQLIEEITTSENNIILFIDEAHTMIGSGSDDTANMLKPALARGQLKIIGATTWKEYKKYIEKDQALTRRFQLLKINEPSRESALTMLRGYASLLMKHHNVMILDEAIEASVDLSSRYITDRKLPDKAISLLDTACSRTALSLAAKPASMENIEKEIEALEIELNLIQKETEIKQISPKRAKELEEKIKILKESLIQVETEWKKEKEKIEELIALRGKIFTDKDNKKKHIAAYDKLRKSIALLQKESPMILDSVNYNSVCNVVSDWTGIPVGKMMKDEIEVVLNLTNILNKRVVGQDHAMNAVSKRIMASKAGVDNPKRPIGVFMFVGPSGVGKTETALALADTLYGGEKNLVTINMSEFQESHTVSTLKGSPPGYVGYGEGGVLTEAVRRKPYSVVLLDEFEKAHSDVHELFFQVFDKGMMEDGEGVEVNFKNTIIILTSNVGSDTITKMAVSGCHDVETILSTIKPELIKHFPPALLGRLVVIPYFPISKQMLDSIIKLQLDRIVLRFKQNRNILLTYDDEVMKNIASKCLDKASGARMVDAVLTHTVLPEISKEYLSRLGSKKEMKEVNIKVEKNSLKYVVH